MKNLYQKCQRHSPDATQAAPKYKSQVPCEPTCSAMWANMQCHLSRKHTTALDITDRTECSTVQYSTQASSYSSGVQRRNVQKSVYSLTTWLHFINCNPAKLRKNIYIYINNVSLLSVFCFLPCNWQRMPKIPKFISDSCQRVQQLRQRSDRTIQ